MTYSEKLKDPRWQRRRLEIMQRDGFHCMDCGSEDCSLNVHHLHYLSGKSPWEYPEELLLTVCEDCHKIRQVLETRAHVALAIILRHADCTAGTLFNRPVPSQLEHVVLQLEEKAVRLNEPFSDDTLQDIVFGWLPDFQAGMRAVKVCKEHGVGWNQLIDLVLASKEKAVALAE